MLLQRVEAPSFSLLRRIPLCKYTITRDIEVKNNLTTARGEWGGNSGERGLQELLAIKDTWTKSRGLEVGSAGVGWRDGEKAHNCN